MKFQKIYICDDHLICRVGVESTLKDLFPDTNLQFFHGARAQDALEFFALQQADLIILDLILPDMPGLELIRRLKMMNVRIPILVLSVCENSRIVSQVLDEGVRGFLSKNHSKEDLKTALVSLSDGLGFVDSYTQGLLSAGGLKDFTPREIEVLELLIKGNTNREIAEILRCSGETIKTHRSNILRKASVRNTAELTAWYLEGHLQSSGRSSSDL